MKFHLLNNKDKCQLCGKSVHRIFIDDERFTRELKNHKPIIDANTEYQSCRGQ